MSRRLLAIATTVALAAVVAVAPAGGATVSLRVESSTDPAPLFDGPIVTLPHAVDGSDGSGAHPCTGPPGAAPAATATGALDDAMRGAGILWRGNWDPSFRDFFIDRIGPYASAAPDRYWSLTVNGRFASGGCLARIADGDSIRFFYGSLFGAASPIVPDGPGDPGGSGGRGGGEETGPGSGPIRKPTRGVATRAGSYLRRHPGAIGAGWGRLALALRRHGDPAAAAAGLIAGRLDELRRSSLDGDVNATALALLALAESQPLRASRLGAWLAAVQSPDGGFGYRRGAAPDVDTTGLATWALALSGRQGAAGRGGAFVRAAQADDGGFPSLPGGRSNSQSTGLALVALRIAGSGPRVASAAGRTPLDYLASHARADGSIAYAEAASPTPAWTTAQALLGLTGRDRLLFAQGRGRLRVGGR